MIDLDKIRKINEGSGYKERVNYFKTVMVDGSSSKDRMIKGMSIILSDLYKPLSRYRRRHGNRGVFGVFDYNEEDDFYYWSCLNFFNTNYTLCQMTKKYLKDNHGLDLLWEDDPNEYAKSFLRMCWNYRHELFLDGEYKNKMCVVQHEIWERGEKYNNYILENFLTFWPNALSVENKSNERGMSEDLSGVDGVIVFEDGKSKIQTKGLEQLKLENDYYVLWVVIDRTKYDNNIDYICFICMDGKVYIFKYDEILVENSNIGGTPVFKIHKSLLQYSGPHDLHGLN